MVTTDGWRGVGLGEAERVGESVGEGEGLVDGSSGASSTTVMALVGDWLVLVDGRVTAGVADGVIVGEANAVIVGKFVGDDVVMTCAVSGATAVRQAAKSRTKEQSRTIWRSMVILLSSTVNRLETTEHDTTQVNRFCPLSPDD
jgi:hypothetical protein